MHKREVILDQLPLSPDDLAVHVSFSDLGRSGEMFEATSDTIAVPATVKDILLKAKIRIDKAADLSAFGRIKLYGAFKCLLFKRTPEGWDSDTYKLPVKGVIGSQLTIGLQDSSKIRAEREFSITTTLDGPGFDTLWETKFVNFATDPDLQLQSLSNQPYHLRINVTSKSILYMNLGRGLAGVRSSSTAAMKGFKAMISAECRYRILLRVLMSYPSAAWAQALLADFSRSVNWTKYSSEELSETEGAPGRIRFLRNMLSSSEEFERAEAEVKEYARMRSDMGDLVRKGMISASGADDEEGGDTL